MELTIARIDPPTWYAGMLQDVFSGEGWTAQCNCNLYRDRMTSVCVTVRGVGRRGFALCSMPLSWSPKVGDVLTIHPSQL